MFSARALSLLRVLSSLVGLWFVGCGSSAAPTDEPASPPPLATPTPPPMPTRYVPSQGQLRIPVDETRGVLGTDVVMRVGAPVTEGGTCHLAMTLRAGTDVREHAIACDAVVVFHGLTLTFDGGPSSTHDGRVGVVVSRDPPSVDASHDCESDDDCVMEAFACCSAPPCDPRGYNDAELAAAHERCARRVCPAFEPRPCGEAPPSTRHPACVDGVCRAVE